MDKSRSVSSVHCRPSARRTLVRRLAALWLFAQGCQPDSGASSRIQPPAAEPAARTPEALEAIELARALRAVRDDPASAAPQLAWLREHVAWDLLTAIDAVAAVQREVQPALAEGALRRALAEINGTRDPAYFVRVARAALEHVGAEPCVAHPAGPAAVERARRALSVATVPAGVAADVTVAFDVYRVRAASVVDFIEVRCAGGSRPLVVGREREAGTRALVLVNGP